MHVIGMEIRLFNSAQEEETWLQLCLDYNAIMTMKDRMSAIVYKASVLDAAKLIRFFIITDSGSN